MYLDKKFPITFELRLEDNKSFLSYQFDSIYISIYPGNCFRHRPYFPPLERVFSFKDSTQGPFKERDETFQLVDGRN